MSAQSRPLKPRTAIARASSLGASFLAAFALAACSADPEPASTASASDSAASSEASAAPTSLEANDAFCELAIQTVPLADEITAQTAGMQELISTALATGDITAVNTWGSELATLDEQMLEFYAEGRQYLEGEAIEAQWTTMESFIRDYSLVLAQRAATSSDTQSFVAAMAEISTADGVAQLLVDGPAAASEIRVYIDDRCGETA